jgi:hypothetical protein
MEPYLSPVTLNILHPEQLIASALTLASGGSIWEAACIGSLAAAIQVGRVGNTPVQRDEIMQELQ